MNKPSKNASRLLSLLLLLPFAAGLGCGQGTYDARMKERLTELKRGTPFLKYLYVTEVEVPETNVSFRLPLIFEHRNTNAWVMGAEDNGRPLDPIRIQPPFVALPGFRFCYEAFGRFPNAPSDMPVYGYVALVDAKEQTADALTSSISQAVAAAFPDEKAAWEPVQVLRPDGGSLAVKRLSVTGQQRFDCTSRGGDDKPYDGRFDLYLVSSKTSHVLLGWRAPIQVTEKFDFFSAAETAVGTLQVP